MEYNQKKVDHLLNEMRKSADRITLLRKQLEKNLNAIGKV